MPIEVNDLECKRFGIVAAHVVSTQARLEEIDMAAREAGVQMLTARVDVNDLPRVHALEADGFRLMDTLVYFERLLKDPCEAVPRTDGVAVRLARPDEVMAVSAVACYAFSNYMGHYHSDPRLNNAAADAAYVEWAAESVARASDDTPVLVAEAEGRVAGFLTLRRNSLEETEIVLNAVHPEHQGQGLYRLLVAEALRLAGRTGAARMIVSTQINNYLVQRVWMRLGFSHFRSFYTFHKWFAD